MRFGNCSFQSVTPVIDATPDYAAGDMIATSPIPINLTGSCGGKGVLNNVSISDKANQKPTMTLLFFRISPTGTYTKNGAVILSAADRAAFLGKIEVTSSDWSTISTDAVATVFGPIVLAGVGTGAGAPASASPSPAPASFTVYCVPVAQAAYNAGAADDLIFNFGILQD